MIKYRVQKDIMGSAFMMSDIQKDIGLMKLVDDLGLEFGFEKGGLYLYVPESATDNLDDIMEEFMTRDFSLAWKGNHSE